MTREEDERNGEGARLRFTGVVDVDVLKFGIGGKTNCGAVNDMMEKGWK